ncbi:MAG: cytochrome c oxidase subunit II [Bacteroidales bacterium]|jgi:cytochrome c oxidase subunit 2
MFKGASNLSAGVDQTFMLILAIAIFFIVGITAFMIWTVIKYNRKKNLPAKQFSNNVGLEIVWTAIPLILVMVIFIYGWKGYAPRHKVPADAMKVTVIGRMWQYTFDYGGGKLSKILVLPVNKPVRLDLHSVDVNHGLFIPAFRVKEDIIPGYKNYLWFIPELKGEFDVLCTVYCGLQHSGMNTKTRIVDESEFKSWLDSLPATGSIPDPEGLVLLKNTGCVACHSIDGSKLVGPTFKGIYGNKRVVVTNGQEVNIEANETYLASSITDPNKEVVKGFNKGLMQSYRDKLTDAQIAQIIDYLKTLADK